MTSSFVSGIWARRSERKRVGIRLGERAGSAQQVFLGMDRLFTHVHAIGPPGSGKTRVLLNIWQQLTDLDACVVLVNPKGALGRMARDWGIARGLSERLIYFDPGDPTHVMGYNPLRANGLPIASQVKAVREALRAAWGQADFSATPQLARVLFWALWAAREMELTLVEALDVIRPHSPLRRQFLESSGDPMIRAALEYFDRLRESRQDELAASSLARLEAFVLDPTIRRIFSQAPRSLDLGEVIARRHLLIVNIEQYRPLRADDVRLVGRLLINDILAHVFARPEHERRTPVILMLDEVQTFLTEDLATALDQGRELGLGCILAHQHMEQLRNEDRAGHLAASVANCARTKIVFGGSTVQEVSSYIDDLVLDRYDPWMVKDEIKTLQVLPIEETREIVTDTVTWGHDDSRALADGVGENTDESGTRSVSGTLTTQRAETRHRASTETESESDTEGYGDASSDGEVRSSGETIVPEVLGPDGAILVPAQVIDTSGSARQTGRGASEFSSSSRSRGLARLEGSGESNGESRSLAIAEGTGWRKGSARSQTRTVGVAERRGGSRSVQVVPFMAAHIEERVSSRTFLSIDEQRLGWMQAVISQRQGHFVLKSEGHPALFVRSVFVETPRATLTQLSRARERMLSRPYFAPIEVVEQEERERRSGLLEDRSARKPPRSREEESF